MPDIFISLPGHGGSPGRQLQHPAGPGTMLCYCSDGGPDPRPVATAQPERGSQNTCCLQYPWQPGVVLF